MANDNPTIGGLTFDNRDLNALVESQLDEIKALRTELRKTRQQLQDAKDENEIMRELVDRRDRQLSELQVDWREFHARQLEEIR